MDQEKREELKTKIMAKVEISGECIIWKGTMHCGSCVLMFHDERINVRRWFLNGEPGSFQALCGNQRCVQPSHQRKKKGAGGRPRGTPITQDVLHDAFRNSEWREEALCKRFDTNIWYEERQATRAIAICNVCPVKNECYEFAMETKQQYGIWGGVDVEKTKA